MGDMWNSALIREHDQCNDICYKACYYVKNFLECRSKNFEFNYWNLTDFLDNINPDQEIFHGGCGLFTFNGIPKSIYFAIMLLNRLDFLEHRPFTTLFAAGNHENYDALRAYPLEDWHGGKIRRIRPSVLLLERGQVFDVGGKRIFAMGGASSHDIQDGILELDDPQFFQKFQRLNAKGAAFRVNHRSWWKEEQPGPEEYQEARKNLERAGWEVDYIITHCAPTSIQNELLQALSKPDELTDFLEEVRLRCQFQYHFFGHYHGDLVIRQKYVLLYKQILRLK